MWVDYRLYLATMFKVVLQYRRVDIYVMVIMETRVSEARASRIIPRLGFASYFQVQPGGRALAFVGPVAVSVDIISFSAQSIDAIIQFNNNREWLLTASYLQDYL